MVNQQWKANAQHVELVCTRLAQRKLFQVYSWEFVESGFQEHVESPLHKMYVGIFIVIKVMTRGNIIEIDFKEENQELEQYLFYPLAA